VCISEWVGLNLSAIVRLGPSRCHPEFDMLKVNSD
jgi:hypothetical protein